MVIDQIGEVARNVYMLGHPRYPLYLINGDRPAIIDTGFSFTADDYAEQIRKVLGGRTPAFCLITHAHYDHCGATASLKRHFPSICIAASPKTALIVQKEGVVRRMSTLGEDAMKTVGDFGMKITNPSRFHPFHVDMTLSEKCVLQLKKGISIAVIEAPGHTRDLLCYYIPEKRILFSSDAAGIPDTTGYIFTENLLDYNVYMSSLIKLSGIDIDTICLGHRCVLTQQDAARYLGEAMHQSWAFFQMVVRVHEEEGGDMARIRMRIQDMEYDPKPLPRQPLQAYQMNLEARITSIIKMIDACS